MPKTVIEIKNLQSEPLPENTAKFVKKACRTVLKNEGFLSDAEISVSFVTQEQIRALNRDYRNIDSVTDVLSFPLNENGYDINPQNGCAMLGDVIICVTRAKQQACELKHSLLHEITFLTVHSVLHLLGFDHIKNEDAQIMIPKQVKAMDLIGETDEQ